MILRVLGSGSSGNCYLLDDGKEILIIEAGISFAEVKEAIDYQTSRIKCVLSSHCHQDHRKYLHEYEKAGIPVMAGNLYHPVGNPLIKTLELRDGECVEFDDCEDSDYCDGFAVYPFEVPHDVKCYGYLIKHPDMGNLIFITDAKYVKYTFPGVNHIMVEANYAQDILDENVSSGEIPESLRNRVMKSHMSFKTAKGMVAANKNPELRNVIMCHLSSRNSDKERFKYEMQKAAGPYCNVHIATKGLEIPLNCFPF